MHWHGIKQNHLVLILSAGTDTENIRNSATCCTTYAFPRGAWERGDHAEIPWPWPQNSVSRNSMKFFYKSPRSTPGAAATANDEVRNAARNDRHRAHGCKHGTAADHSRPRMRCA